MLKSGGYTMNARNRKRRTADTTRQSYRECKKEGLFLSLEKKIINLLDDEPLPKNSREISLLLHQERTAVTKALNTLERQKRLEVAHKNPCKKTGRRTKHYRLNYFAD